MRNRTTVTPEQIEQVAEDLETLTKVVREMAVQVQAAIEMVEALERRLPPQMKSSP